MQQDILKKLHEVELELLDEFHRICSNHDLPYFLDSGTALGAVRHKGFIPWDDDIDVGMLRSDFESFLVYAGKELKKQYCLQYRKNEPNYNQYSAKLRKRNTLFPETASENYNERGIFIDIFPFDFVDDNMRKARGHTLTARYFLRFLRFLQVRNDGRHSIKNAMRIIVSLIPEKWVEKKYLSYCISKKKTNHITCYSYKMARNRILIFDLDKMLPVHLTPFEGKSYYIMNDPDHYLTIMYDNYMVMPPKEKRISHVNEGILFEYQSNQL